MSLLAGCRMAAPCGSSRPGAEFQVCVWLTTKLTAGGAGDPAFKQATVPSRQRTQHRSAGNFGVSLRRFDSCGVNGSRLASGSPRRSNARCRGQIEVSPGTAPHRRVLCHAVASVGEGGRGCHSRGGWRTNAPGYKHILAEAGCTRSGLGIDAQLDLAQDNFTV